MISGIAQPNCDPLYKALPLGQYSLSANVVLPDIGMLFTLVGRACLFVQTTDLLCSMGIFSQLGLFTSACGNSVHFLHNRVPLTNTRVNHQSCEIENSEVATSPPTPFPHCALVQKLRLATAAAEPEFVRAIQVW